MGVLIKGMKMPKNCGDCWFEYAFEFCESKFEDCPLIELPPHGRLIDADALQGNTRSVVMCKDCRHRDPEDHKCDCGQLERAGCVFPVDDDYFCAYGENK